MALKPPSARTILLGAAALYVWVQLNAICAPFTLIDDRGEFCFIRGLRSWHQCLGFDVFGYFRPVKNLLFLLFNFMGGPAHLVWPARLTAIAIGTLTIGAVYACLRRILPTPRQAAFAAGVWILAPTMVSCTAWLSCLNIQIMAALACLAIVAHDSGRVAIAAVLFFLASLCYEGGLATAALFIAFDFFLRPKSFACPRHWISYGVYAAVALLYLGLRVAVNTPGAFYGSFGADTTPLQASFSSAWFTWQHLRNWLIPFNRFALMNSYCWGDVPVPLLLLCWCILAGFVAACLIFRQRQPVPALGIAWFLLAFAPMSNLPGFKNGPYGDYYLALASIGLAVATVWLVAELHARHSRILGIAVLAIIAVRGFGVLESAAWASYWNDPKTLFVKCAETFPDSFLWRLQIAQLACDAGEDALAWERIDEIHSAHPDAVGCYPVLAKLESRRGRPAESLSYIKRFLEYVPGNVSALVFEAGLQSDAFKNPAEAERLYRQALQMPVCAATGDAARGLAGLLSRPGGNPAEAASLRTLAARLADETEKH